MNGTGKDRRIAEGEREWRDVDPGRVITLMKRHDIGVRRALELPRFRGHIDSEAWRKELRWRERIRRIHLSSAGRWLSW